MTDAKIGSLILSAIMDFRCVQTMIKNKLLSPQVGKDDMTVSMVRMHGETYMYPWWQLVLTIMGKTEKLYPMLPRQD